MCAPDQGKGLPFVVWPPLKLGRTKTPRTIPALKRTLKRVLGVAGLLLPLASSATMIASPMDQRQFQDMALPNGLRVVLISDSETDKAAVSLDVQVGSGSDPEDRAGLAHFLEHMLFLGTEAYPEAGEYQGFITRHGGSENAYTSYAHTNYYFDIDADYLEGALDRFAGFFTSPLFNPEFVERERAVVHSEYTSGLKKDGRRIRAVRQLAFDRRHPRSGFAVGSLQTLADRPGDLVRQDLLGFYRRFYTAPNMTLVVLGHEDLEVLENWVVTRFADLPAGGESPGGEVPGLYGENKLPLQQKVVPIAEMRYGLFTFPLPARIAHYREKPLAYLGHLLGHEGPGSLLSVLKAQGWAEALSAGTGMSNDNESTFEISISLTEAGLGAYDEVGRLLFQAIQQIRNEGLKPWVYQEQKTLAEIDFRFQERTEPMDLVRALARRMHDYPVTDLLYGPYRYDRFDPGLIRDFLGRLVPQNLHLLLVGPELETDATEEHYQVDYSLGPLPLSILTAWTDPPQSPSLRLPLPNPFISTDLELRMASAVSKVPERIEIGPGFSLWFQNDTSFGFPKGNFFVSIRSPFANDSPRNAGLTQLYVATVLDQLNDVTYSALLAGLGFEVYDHGRGISLKLRGYSARQGELLSIVLAALKAPEVSPERFARVRTQLLRALKNDAHQDPAGRIMSDLNRLLVAPAWWPDELAAAVEDLDPEDLEAFVPRFLGQGVAVALAHGNYLQDDATDLAKTVRRELLEHRQVEIVDSSRVLKLDKGTVARLTSDADHLDSAFVGYFQGQSRQLEERAAYLLIGQLLESPFYKALRTRQKMGYVVVAGFMPLRRVPGLVFLVQSPDRTPDEIRSAIEIFLRGFSETLEHMPSDVFEQYRQSILMRINIPDQRLGERSARYWHEIDRKAYAFDSRERLSAAILAQTLKTLRRFFTDNVLSNARRMMVVRTFGTDKNRPGSGEQSTGPKIKEITSAASFRDNRQWFD